MANHLLRSLAWRNVLRAAYPDRAVPLLSIAAAIPTSAIEELVTAQVPVVRAMPNTPATVHEGIAGICAGAHAGDEHLAAAEEVLLHLARRARTMTGAQRLCLAGGVATPVSQ